MRFRPSRRVCLLEVLLHELVVSSGCILVNSLCAKTTFYLPSFFFFIAYSCKYKLRFWVTAQSHFDSDRV